MLGCLVSRQPRNLGRAIAPRKNTRRCRRTPRRSRRSARRALRRRATSRWAASRKVRVTLLVDSQSEGEEERSSERERGREALERTLVPSPSETDRACRSRASSTAAGRPGGAAPSPTSTMGTFGSAGVGVTKTLVTPSSEGRRRLPLQKGRPESGASSRNRAPVVPND